MTSRRSLPLALLLIFGLVAGCGGAQPGASPPPATPSTGTGFPVTVTNCGVTTTYRQAPRRAVTMNQHVTEIMLALGLERSMAGTAYLDDRIPPRYEAAYRSIKVLAEEYPSYEALLSAEPDFVYGGFTSAFDDQEGRSRRTLAEAGIDSYLSLEACPSGPVTMDLLEEEIRTIGRVFGVPERAEQRVAELRGVLEGVRAKLGGVEPVKVFVYDSGDKTAFTAGGAGIGNDLISRAGGVNLFADLAKAFGDVSFEQVAERAPDVIVIYDYGDQTVADKKRFLLANPALKDVPAVKEQRFAVLPLSSTVLGVRAPEAVESLARQLHPDHFA
ncbi:ABC transporter substrate-binding protein [Nonomuraea antimicrobica]|uniref:ABC transporter substrate-binding protein n=1 Tax=Nonomuraea antimicrobica TaxID=561173 RepID=A0ABP7BIV2_9ACTN